jgi:glycosyltransferase involved in cell wall biosynthesis
MNTAASSFSVVHLSPRVQALGGIETLHKYHRTLPGRQIFVALFDREPESRPDYINLNFTWRTPLWVMRRRFQRALRPHAGSLCVYHNGWGLPLFHDLDRAARRVVFFHADPAFHRPELSGFRGLPDGVMGISPGLPEFWREEMPEIEVARTGVCPLPVESPSVQARSTRGAGAPLVLGYAGRIERAQKRLDLLPGLLDALDGLGVDYRFELAGTGAFQPWLQQRLGPRVRFHGRLANEDYWRALSDWDGAVYFSENEGGPIALLEAMAVGAIPFYPRNGGSWADAHAPRVDPLCHYPPGNMTALASAVQQVFSRTPAAVAALRMAARSLVKMHDRDVYRAFCAGMFERIWAQPRCSARRLRRPRITDLLPLGVVTRMAPGALRRS